MIAGCPVCRNGIKGHFFDNCRFVHKPDLVFAGDCVSPDYINFAVVVEVAFVEIGVCVTGNIELVAIGRAIINLIVLQLPYNVSQ